MADIDALPLVDEMTFKLNKVHSLNSSMPAISFECIS